MTIRLAVPEHSTPTVDTPRNSASFWGKLSDQEGKRSLRYSGKPAVGGISNGRVRGEHEIGFHSVPSRRHRPQPNCSEHVKTTEDLSKEWHRNDYHTNHSRCDAAKAGPTGACRSNVIQVIKRSEVADDGSVKPGRLEYPNQPFNLNLERLTLECCHLETNLRNVSNTISAKNPMR